MQEAPICVIVLCFECFGSESLTYILIPLWGQEKKITIILFLSHFWNTLYTLSGRQDFLGLASASPSDVYTSLSCDMHSHQLGPVTTPLTLYCGDSRSCWFYSQPAMHSNSNDSHQRGGLYTAGRWLKRSLIFLHFILSYHIITIFPIRYQYSYSVTMQSNRRGASQLWTYFQLPVWICVIDHATFGWDRH